MTAKIEIYYSPLCSYCLSALALLKKYEVTFAHYNVLEDDTLRQEMHKRVPEATTVPQIFINNIAIGGRDELYELHQQGILSSMLTKSSSS